MAGVLTRDVLDDDLAVTLARVMAAANRRAGEMGVSLPQSLITITQHAENRDCWRVNYGPRDYISRRGGDVMIEVDARDDSVTEVLKGQ